MIAIVVLALLHITFAQPIQIGAAGLGYSSYAFSTGSMQTDCENMNI